MPCPLERWRSLQHRSAVFEERVPEGAPGRPVVLARQLARGSRGQGAGDAALALGESVPAREIAEHGRRFLRAPREPAPRLALEVAAFGNVRIPALESPGGIDLVEDRAGCRIGRDEGHALEPARVASRIAER